MQDLAAVSQRLRVVRTACRRFLEMHAMEVTVIEPALDRVAADLEADLDLDETTTTDGPSLPLNGEDGPADDA